MDIYLDKLDIITQNKYQEFKEKVEELLAFYQKTNSEKYNLVKEKQNKQKVNGILQQIQLQEVLDIV